MRKLLRVQWIILPRIAPQPWIACSRCGISRPFQSSGKIRLNVNGKRLDAWLIYKCAACGTTWNRPIFERRNVRDIDPVDFEAMQANDAEWILKQAFNIDALRRHTHHIDGLTTVEVRKNLLESCDGGCDHAEIRLNVPLPTALRLDRLISAGLDLARAQVQEWHDVGKLRIDPSHKSILRRPVRDGCVIIIKHAEPSNQKNMLMKLVLDNRTAIGL
jgi:hypothetical protein